MKEPAKQPIEACMPREKEENDPFESCMHQITAQSQILEKAIMAMKLAHDHVEGRFSPARPLKIEYDSSEALDATLRPFSTNA
ncbi:hypothetical protein OIU77_015402 [Salix suchowensis]|uniref:Uncharacterized protein n=1 Tax=Salix suchowensis TaxID=1278906 RepID=A0ABQ8ZH24_9ROSI|nr:hypothetical protein OIU77_015402 [Salix suchowensis]